MRNGAQGKAVEAGGRRVQVTYRWEALYARIEGGERVEIERASKRNNYGWVGVRQEEKKTIHKTGEEKVGTEGLD